ncbi:hypothetical protein N7481_007761 [Penicillium waksmanii]|uniref:uncharacterized protein n=1 Tax=Penicillium waksmanii TaxID=69791 RepID=UPI002549492A|nr:uncharacterized protein N7481_007761 [Penicillium waksmanii]KAJ5980463.1 hypothetical protein N7481_007761 [Penicillium waksmanii]
MRIALLTLFSGALVTALSGEEALNKWGGDKGWGKGGGGKGGGGLSHGGNNIGNGDGGGINIDTGGGDIGDIGVGVGGGGGGGGGCDPNTCNYECQQMGDQSGYCYNGSGSPSILGLVLGQTSMPLWLLPTSLLSTSSPDALIRVTFDAGMKSVAGEEYISMLTQNAMVHRILPLDKTVLVSELHTFTLAQLTYNNTIAGQWLPAEAVTNNTIYTQAG